MPSTGTLNLAAVASAVGLSLVAAMSGNSRHATQPLTLASHAGAQLVERGGNQGLVDATGRFFPLQRYERVISTTGVADDLLHALAEPERIVAFSAYARRSANGYRFGSKVLARPSLDAEAILELKPDLILINNLSRQDRITRLREAGISVFDLGEMRGLRTLIPNIHTVAILLGRPEAGAQLADSINQRMRALAELIPPTRRTSGLYAGIHGDKIYGGSTGTSYADVLAAAGVEDAAAGHYRDWPRYTSEQLLLLDPQVIITQAGMTERLCRHPGLQALRACREHRIVEIDPALLLDPGLEMPLAAEEVQAKIYGHTPDDPRRR